MHSHVLHAHTNEEEAAKVWKWKKGVHYSDMNVRHQTVCRWYKSHLLVLCVAKQRKRRRSRRWRRRRRIYHTHDVKQWVNRVMNQAMVREQLEPENSLHTDRRFYGTHNTHFAMVEFQVLSFYFKLISYTVINFCTNSHTHAHTQTHVLAYYAFFSLSLPFRPCLKTFWICTLQVHACSSFEWMINVSDEFENPRHISRRRDRYFISQLTLATYCVSSRK